MATIGILAHVDAGKTTLSENILYKCGVISDMGRVDRGDTVLDTDPVERARGITIYVGCAHFDIGNRRFTLLDTPGHTDFSAETERTLSVLDYAILVVSGAEGVQGHTGTLFKLLERYQVPVFIFVNKMDRSTRDSRDIMAELTEELAAECVEFSPDFNIEDAAACDEILMERYLSTSQLTDGEIAAAVGRRRLFPVYFGSALHGDGIDELMTGLRRFTQEPRYPADFCARVYKITHDDRHAAMTHMKILGGRLAIRDRVGDDKVTRIRICDGERYTEVTEAGAGECVTVTGLESLKAGQGINCEDAPVPVLEPVMTYRLEPVQDIQPVQMMSYLKELQSEMPELAVEWIEQHREILVRVMGLIQLEVLTAVIKARFDVDVTWGAGTIVYKETIANTAEGVGHFEPLRHYAEVHLLLEPGERGSGIVCGSDVSTDDLALNWQRLILTHIMEKRHAGVLTGAELTDVKITLKAGRAHQKHTEGGDFRQAVYRAVRQGLMQAESLLLEPYYDFEIHVPTENLGRTMTDIDSMSGHCDAPRTIGDESVLTGYGPVSELWDYHKDIIAYTRGRGTMTCSMHGYDICHDAQAVIERFGYDPELDIQNPTGSVFCAHGSGFYVPWYDVPQYMHVESIFSHDRDDTGIPVSAVRTARVDEWIDPQEVDRILRQATHANAREKGRPAAKRTVSAPVRAAAYKPAVIKPRYLLVDGYNIIFAWDELRDMAKENIDGARQMLCDIVSNYAGYKGIETAVVFDAYRLQNHKTEMLDYYNIKAVYTATAQTADHYIERFTNENASRYDITVATSDGIEQIIIRSQGCRLLSATAFRHEIDVVNEEIRDALKH